LDIFFSCAVALRFGLHQ